ncbi:MAG: hypothetical protein JST11_25300 [Acidobacteria bacterium]|nr:hypothetical protein [Acidobacteriota bacterium]
MACPYCGSTLESAWFLTEDAAALPHPTPLTACHMIVIPRRHVSAFYDLDVGEQRGIWDVVTMLRERIAAALPVAGFHAGFRDVPPDGHAEVHLVPRVRGSRLVLPPEIEWVDLDS